MFYIHVDTEAIPKNVHHKHPFSGPSTPRKIHVEVWCGKQAIPGFLFWPKTCEKCIFQHFCPWTYPESGYVGPRTSPESGCVGPRTQPNFAKFVLRLRWRLTCFFFVGRVQEYFPIFSEPISEFSGHFQANVRGFYTISGIFVPGPQYKIGPFVLGPYLNILVLPLDLVPKNEICPRT